jgi:hypothetical protein
MNNKVLIGLIFGLVVLPMVVLLVVLIVDKNPLYKGKNDTYNDAELDNDGNASRLGVSVNGLHS